VVEFKTSGTLEVVGQLLVEMGDDSARIEARGERIVIDLPCLDAGVAVLRRWSRGRDGRSTIRRFHLMLTSVGLSVQVDIASETVGLLGFDARPGLISRLLGLYPLEIRLGALWRAPRHHPDRPPRS